MNKRIISIIILTLLLGGCSKMVNYKYDQVELQNGDWILNSGSVSVRDGSDSMIFKVKYVGDKPIDSGESWGCDVLICEDNKASSIDEADVVFSRLDVYSNTIGVGDIIVVETDNDVIEEKNEYNFDSIYLKIIYTIDKEEQTEIIKLSLKN